MALVLDTGPLYALLDLDDEDHLSCRRLIEDAVEALLIPAPVLVEVEQLATSRLGPRAFPLFLADVIAGAYEVVDLVDDDLVRIEEVLSRYADTPIGFVDASVLAVVERLDEPKVATLDEKHFRMLRPRHVPALELLPAPR